MSGRGNVHRGCVWSGKCLSGMYLVGKMSVGEESVIGGGGHGPPGPPSVAAPVWNKTKDLCLNEVKWVFGRFVFIN